jgi:hypothetical protein
MRTFILAASAALVLAGTGPPLRPAVASSSQELLPADLDRLLAPIALYPDQLLAQMLLSATDPAGVTALNAFLKSHSTLKGTELQDAVLKNKFEPSFVALALFPQVVQQMAARLDLTTQVGKAFTADRSLVFESIQRLRTQAHNAGTLKTTPQQEVEKQTTPSGQQVIVIEPANPQVVYVPQYNPTVVYTQPATTVVVQESSSADAAVAGVIGFTAGIAIGAAVNNNYYYGPYGWRGGAYMYNDAWDDYYDHREDARDDWQDHREDLADERGDRARTAQEQRTERAGTAQEQRTERAGTTQEQRTDRAATRQGNTSTAAATRGGSSYESRGYSQSADRARTATTQERSQPAATRERSGTKSDAFSGYSSGKSERAASSRGKSSRSSSRSRGGGGRRR